MLIVPSGYTLRHARGYGRSALRFWTLQGSLDGEAWVPLSVHKADQSLNEPGSTASWFFLPPEEDVPFRHFRIHQVPISTGSA